MENNWSKKINKASQDPEAGFLFINKPTGWTSHDVVAKLRNQIKTKKIGHAGTLDPLATGLLIIGINKATTLLDLWHQFPKTYIAELEFGKISDTFDSEGEIKILFKNPKIKKSDLEKLINSFIGKQLQTPPPFSAVKIKGKKAYDLARQGKPVELKPKQIEILSLKLINLKSNKATINITCSTGTYIRRLINDIGIKIGVGAIMTKLERTEIGPFDIEGALGIDQINIDNYQKKLFKPSDLLTLTP